MCPSLTRQSQNAQHGENGWWKIQEQCRLTYFTEEAQGFGKELVSQTYLDHFWIRFCFSRQQVLGLEELPPLVLVEHC